MLRNFYPWKFPINFKIFDNIEDLENIKKILTSPEFNNKLFLKYFHNLLVSKKKFNKKIPLFSEIIAYQLINEIYFHIVFDIADKSEPDYLINTLSGRMFNNEVIGALVDFISYYPSLDLLTEKKDNSKLFIKKNKGVIKKQILSHILITRVMNENPACEHFNQFFNDGYLMEKDSYRRIVDIYNGCFEKNPILPVFNKPLLKVLYEPIKTCPDSLIKQLNYIKSNWINIIPHQIQKKFDILRALLEEEKTVKGAGGPGPIEVLEFKKNEKGKIPDTYEYPEFEAYTPDTDWMPNVVLIAKMAYVWLYQLSKQYHREIKRLDEIPDEELDKLARWGFNALWLIGIWERSPASQRIKHLCGNIDAASSAYSLYDYSVADELGGWNALYSLKEKAWKRGIRLACDIVPNHMGIVSKWIFEHPDWFIQSDFPPFPNYKFTSENLSNHSDYIIQIEDGYYTRTDAAVVFRFEEKKTGKVRYIYHGNDGTSTPWNDTAQLNYLIPQVRQKMIETIVNIAKHFPIIRFDAAMTLAKKHYQRLWFPIPGHGGGVPSRGMFGMEKSEFDRLMPKEFWREVVETINSQVPDTLLIAEAFWLMEGYFVRTLGMHRVYNSAFMNMLKMEENAKYRQTIKNILEFDRRILQRFVNFMNNPDEKTAVEQFGKGDKYFGVAVMLVTMPGLPMFGHGQIEGFHEKYGMEYKRAYYDEQPDQYFIAQHEEKIFPLIKRRRLFSGSENFYFYDFISDGNVVNENVFVYSNMFGNERALIVYNNNLSTTKGTIKTTVKYLKKLADGSEIYETKSLIDAINLRKGPKYFYVCKDHNSNLEHLFKTEEIDKKGFTLEVRGYQYYVFMDFREVYDEKGFYEELYQKLEGKPVKSVEEELKLIKYRELHNVLLLILEELTFKPEFKLSNENALNNLITQFYKFFLMQDCAQATLKNGLGESFLESVKKLFSNYEYFFNEEIHFKAYINEVSILIFLHEVFKNLLAVKGGGIKDIYSEYRFDLVLNNFFRKKIEDGVLSHYCVHLINLLNLVLEHESHVEDSNFIEKVFMDEEDLEILGANISEGVKWFNKELFEIFILVITSIKVEVELEKKADMIRKALLLIRAAEESRYRVHEFLNILKLKDKQNNSNLTQ